MTASSPISDICSNRRSSELAGLAGLRRSGGTVAGYTCHAFPAAVLAGLGMRPVRALCGASADAETRGEQFVRADACPHVKSLLGNVSAGRDVHGLVDLWVGLQTCDQMRRGMASLADALGRTVIPLHLPATRTPEAAGYYAGEVRRLVDALEARTGRAFDPAAAAQWQQDHDRAAAVLSRAGRSGKVSPLDLHHLFHLLFLAQPERLAAFFEETIAGAPAFQAAKTVVLTGSPIACEDTVLLEELKARGIAAVPLNCTGLDAVDDGETFAATDDPVQDLALRAFRRPPCSRVRPNRPVFERISRALQETNASGLIVKCLTFCDHWYTERERMRSSFPVPVLVFDSDYAEGGRERLLSRIDAFVETLG